MAISGAIPSPTAASPGSGSISSTASAPPSPEDAGARRRGQLYGRRKGRPLSARQQRLIDGLLPGLAVPMAGAGPIDPATLFDPRPAQVWLEIGFGAGEHLAHQAHAHPAVGLIGCEPYINGVARLLARVEDARLANVRIHADDARPLLARLPDACLARLFVLFPDPWPKARHGKRRLVSPAGLDVFARLLADGGRLHVASDAAPYLTDALAAGLAHPAFAWQAERAADWARPENAGLLSRCEAKAAKAGRPAAYLSFVRHPRRPGAA